MSDALSKAFAEADRSYLSAKAAAGRAPAELLASGPSGLPFQQSDLGNAKEQLRHFKGYPFAAIRAIASTISGQPIRCGRVVGNRKLTGRKSADGDDANVEPIDQHPVLDLFHDPNSLMVGRSLLYLTAAMLELTGKCLWWLPIEDDRRMCYPLASSWITGRNGSTAHESWRILPPGTAEHFDVSADNACYFAYPNPADPLHGVMAPLQAAASPVDSHEAIQASQRAMFAHGVHPSHALIVGKHAGPDGTMATGSRPKLTSAQQKQLITVIRKRYEGVTKWHEPLILDGVIESITKLSNSPAEMDFMQSGDQVLNLMSLIFNVNNIVLGRIEGANRASSTEAKIHFAEFCINPKIALLSETLTGFLGGSGGMFSSEGERLKIWIEPYTPKDVDTEVKQLDLLGKYGCITYDEMRAWYGLPPLPQGGELLVGQADSLGAAIDQRVNSTMGEALAARMFVPSPVPLLNGHSR